MDVATFDMFATFHPQVTVSLDTWLLVIRISEEPDMPTHPVELRRRIIWTIVQSTQSSYVSESIEHSPQSSYELMEP